MDYRLDDEVRFVRRSLREFLLQHMPELHREPPRGERVRAVAGLGAAGWLEQYADAVHSGDPATLVGALVVAEEFGRVPVPGALAPVAGFLLPLAALAGLPGVGDRVREGAVLAAAVPALIGSSGDPRWGFPTASVSGRRRGDSLVLNGCVIDLPGAPEADQLVLPVELDDGIVLASAPSSATGVRVEPTEGLDLRSRCGRVHFTDVEVPGGIIGSVAELASALQTAAAAYSLFVDAQALGGADEVIRRTVEYTTSRVQFGRPVGSFQAIRHRLADAAILVEGARSLAHRAAWDLAAGRPGAVVDVVASRLAASTASLRAGEAAVQCHGGMGFTWEQGLHTWYRAAVADRGRADVPALRAAIGRHLAALAEVPPGAPRDWSDSEGP